MFTNLPVGRSLISASETTFGSVDTALRMYPVTLSSASSGEVLNKAVNPMEEVAWSMIFNSMGGEGSAQSQEKKQVNVKRDLATRVSQYTSKKYLIKYFENMFCVVKQGSKQPMGP